MRTIPGTLITAGMFISVGIAAGQSTQAGYQNFVRQVQLPSDGSAGVVWNVPVEAAGEQLSPLEINPGGARFELHTVSSDPFIGYLLDTKYVGAYIPVAEIQIRTEDPYETVPRTRADRPFNVEITMNGLLAGADDPDPSKMVKVLHHVQSYGVGGDIAGIDRDQAILLGQGFIDTNGTRTMSYLVNSVPGADRAKIRGEERFSAFSLADYQAPESHLDSVYVQIWPVADGSIAGISEGDLICFRAPALTISLNDLYPDSQTYTQVYKGNQSLGTEGAVIPGSALIINQPIPQNRILSLEDWDRVIDSDGVWTLEILTTTPFGVDRLAHVTFTVDRTITVNGSVTTIE
jgi:hypothetical protein